MAWYIAPMSDEHLIEARTRSLGLEIFDQIGLAQPSALNQKFWSGRFMEWSFERPELKLNLFRLVDVLPSLRSPRAIAEHVREYLGDSESGFKGLISWGARARPSSMRGKLIAMIIKRGVGQMARQFIAGTSAQASARTLHKIREQGLCFTLDLLGEYSVSEREAEAYLERYLTSLDELAAAAASWPRHEPLIPNHPGDQSPICVSVKLSALYSQCSPLNFDNSVRVLSGRLTKIVEKAQQHNASLYVDAEDTQHNPVFYAVFKEVFGSAQFKNFPYPGIVIQSYCRNAEETLDDLLDFARERGTPIAIRLVKGAYWDAETAWSNQRLWECPVFSHKAETDLMFERLSRRLLESTAHCLPAFGSHNVRSLAYACAFAECNSIPKDRFELQMLFGMAEPIARAFRSQGYLTRLYVPLGELIPGMGYLVRRLLENSSNESFLRHTFVDQHEREGLLRPPVITQ